MDRSNHTVAISFHVMEYIVRIVLLLWMIGVAQSEDPCKSENHRELNNTNDDLNKTEWIRPVSPLSYLLPTNCTGIQRCGDKDPIWMNDTYPTNNETRNVSMCATSVSGKGCCVKKYQIEVKDCGSYYVYHHKPPEEPGQAYCFEPNLITESTIPCKCDVSQSTNGVNTVATEATVQSSDAQSTTVATTESTVNSGETAVAQTIETTTHETTNGHGSMSENTKDKTALAFLIICSITSVGSLIFLCYLRKSSSINGFCTNVLRFQNINRIEVAQPSQRALVQDNRNGVADLLINPQVTEVGRPPMRTNTFVQ